MLVKLWAKCFQVDGMVFLNKIFQSGSDNKIGKELKSPLLLKCIHFNPSMNK